MTLKGNSFPRYSLQSENTMSHYLSFSAETNASTCCLAREVTERWELHIRVSVSEAMMLSRRENGQVQSNLRTRAVRLWTSSLCSLMRLHLSNFEATWQFTPKFLLKLKVLMCSYNEQNQGPNKTKALRYFLAHI